MAAIFGGFIVLLSLAYAFRGCIPSHWQEYWEKFPIPSTVLIAAAAYVVGYAVQDVGGVLRLTPTGRLQPGCLLRWLYKCFTRVPWQDTYYPNDREFTFEIRLGRLEIPDPVIQALERIRSLKVISMCVGGCLALSALIVLLQLVFYHPSVPTDLVMFIKSKGETRGALSLSSVAIDLVIFFVSALLATCLIFLGRMKGMQEMQFYQSIHDAGFPEKKTGTQ
jgi:hypothetical protein